LCFFFDDILGAALGAALAAGAALAMGAADGAGDAAMAGIAVISVANARTVKRRIMCKSFSY
jgi:hypothetical protein